MNQHNSVLKNFIIYALGSFGSKALSFILLPLYSFYLNRSEFGIYDLFISAISLAVPLVTLQTSESVYRWLIEKNNSIQKAKIISNGLIVILITSVFFLLAVLIASTFVKVQYLPYFLGILITSSFFSFFQSVLRGLGENKKYSISGVTNTFFILFLNIIFIVFLNMKLVSLFIAMIMSNFIGITYIIVTNDVFRKLSFKFFDFRQVKLFVNYSLPLVPNTISWFLITLVDKFLILKFLNVEYNGIYAIATRFSSIIMLLNTIFLLAWQDHSLVSNESTDNSQFRSKLFNQFVVFQLSVVIILIAITPYIINFTLAKEYHISSKYVSFLYIGVAYSSFAGYIGVGFQKFKKTKNEFYTTLFGGIFNIVISLVLLKKIGLYAPALGTFLSFLLVFILRKIQTDKFYKTEIDIPNLIVLSVLALMMSGVAVVDNPLVKLLAIVLSFFIFIFFNFNLIKRVKGSLVVKFQR
jgi:O-antigen/teichoic acid export membrane protein